MVARLVEKHDVRAGEQELGQQDAPLLAAAELVNAPFADLGHVEADRAEGGTDRLVVGRAGGAHVACDGGPLQLQPGVLERQPDRSHLTSDRRTAQQDHPT